MKATELRIRNIVYKHHLDNDNSYKTEHEISGYDLECLDVDGCFYKEGEASGIPLTEEWLLKLHNEDEIEKSKRFPNEIIIYDRFLFIWKSEYKYWYVVTAYHKEYLTKIEFVHEYQNFILVLTGEELINK